MTEQEHKQHNDFFAAKRAFRRMTDNILRVMPKEKIDALASIEHTIFQIEQRAKDEIRDQLTRLEDIIM